MYSENFLIINLTDKTHVNQVNRKIVNSAGIRNNINFKIIVKEDSYLVANISHDEHVLRFRTTYLNA